MTNVIDSFSYGLAKVSIVQEAKDKAKKEGQSFSEYVLQLLENDLKKEEALERVPIISRELRQTTINEYIIVYINNLTERSDEELERALSKIPKEKTDRIYEKLGTMRAVLFDMDHPN